MWKSESSSAGHHTIGTEFVERLKSAPFMDPGMFLLGMAESLARLLRQSQKASRTGKLK